MASTHMLRSRPIAKWGVPAAMALAMTAGVPAIASAQPAPAPQSPAAAAPFCAELPMIMIYPPPPTVVVCHTGFGDVRFTLPPGWHWPF